MHLNERSWYQRAQDLPSLKANKWKNPPKNNDPKLYSGGYMTKQEANELYDLLGEIKGLSQDEIRQRKIYAATGSVADAIRVPRSKPARNIRVFNPRNNIPGIDYNRGIRIPKRIPKIDDHLKTHSTPEDEDLDAPTNENSSQTQKRSSDTTSIKNGILSITRTSFQAAKLLSGIFLGFKVIKKLERVPSALGGVIKLLEIGFLLTLKPLADLLAILLMPVAVGMIKFAIWLNNQSKFVKTIVAILEAIVMGIVGLAMLFGKSSIGKLLTSGAELLSKAIVLILDSEAMGKFLEKLYGFFIKWWNNSDIKFVLDWIYGKIKMYWEKSPLKGWADYIYKAIIKKWEESALKGIFEKIALRIGESLEKSAIGTVLGKIGTILGEIVGEKVGFTAILKGIIGTFGKIFSLTFFAGIIGEITLWIASKLDEDNPIKKLLEAVGELLVAVGLFDPLGWLWDIANDISNAINGDFSFTNTTDRVNEIITHLGNAIEAAYLFITDMLKKYGVELNDDGTRRKIEEAEAFEAAGGSTWKPGGIIKDLFDYATGWEQKNELGDYEPGKQKKGGIDGEGESDVRIIPKAAKGGIVKSPTILMAGEAGSEAIIPLDNMNSFRNNINIYFSGVVDEQKMRRIIRDEAEKIFNVHTRVRGNVW